MNHSDEQDDQANPSHNAENTETTGHNTNELSNVSEKAPIIEPVEAKEETQLRQSEPGFSKPAESTDYRNPAVGTISPQNDRAVPPSYLSNIPSNIPNMTMRELPVTPEPAPKKKHRGILATLIVLLLVILAGSFTWVFAGDKILLAVKPNLYLAMAVDNTFDTLEKEYALAEKVFGAGKIDMTQGYETKMKFGIDSLSVGDKEDMISNLAIQFINEYSKKKSQMSFNSSFIHKDETLVSLGGFWNDEEAGISIPELTKDYFVIETKKFGQKWNNSFLGSGYSLNEDLDVSISKFITKNKPELSAETKEALKTESKNLLKKFEIQETMNDSVEIGDSTKKAICIDAVLDSKEFTDYLDTVLDILEDDEGFDDYFDQLNGFYQSLGSPNSFDKDQYFKEMKDAIKKIKLDDIELTFITYQKMIIGFDSDFVLNKDEYAESKTKVSFGYYGEENMIDEIRLDVGVKSKAQNADLSIDLAGNHVPKNGEFSSKLTLKAKYNGDTVASVNGNIAIDLEKKSNNLSCKYELKSDETTATLDLNGDYENGKEFTLNFDKLNLITGKKGDSNYVNLAANLNYNTTKSDDKFSKEDFEKVDILGMDEDDFSKYVEDNNLMNKVENLYFNLYDVFASFSSANKADFSADASDFEWEDS